jgi:hypothetical protein
VEASTANRTPGALVSVSGKRPSGSGGLVVTLSGPDVAPAGTRTVIRLGGSTLKSGTTAVLNFTSVAPANLKLGARRSRRFNFKGSRSFER